MANYKKTYADFFGYSMTSDEFVPSEISGQRAVDPHHIYPKGMGGRKTFIHNGVTYDIDAIENLIAVTRKEHTAADDPTDPDHLTKDELWSIHQKKMEAHLRISKSKMQ